MVNYKRIIELIFDNYEEIKLNFGSDGMGEYIRYGYPTDYFYYPSRDIILDRWEQKLDSIPYVRVRDIHEGYGNNWRHSVMELNDEYYLVEGARIRFGSDKPGPHGVRVFHFDFNRGGDSVAVKTERSFKMALNKCKVTPI